MIYDANEHSQLVVREPKTLDFVDMVKLQQVAFSDIIEKTGTGYLFTEPYYRWKYSAPAGNAKIALIYDQEGLVAVNSMYPLNIIANGIRACGWQSCDTATHPRGRGRGYFVRCIDALKMELDVDNVFFGFPNNTSKPGLVKCGWTHHSHVRTWARVLPGQKITRFILMERVKRFKEEQNAFFKEYAAVRGGAMIERDSAYMSWRYEQHPFHQYESFEWREKGRLLGITVLRKATIVGRELAIIMELLALMPHVERGMLAFAAAWARKNGVLYTVALNNTTKTSTGVLSGYIPVPMWALPKRQILMGTTTSGTRAQDSWNMPWHVQIGDWDGF